MRHLIVVASISALAVSAASCGSSREGANSSDLLSAASITGPSPSAMTEARGGGKGGGTTPTGGGSGTISLRMVLDVGTAGTSFKDWVTFDVSTSATQYPWVTVKCTQNGTLVYKMSNGIFPTSLGDTFTLGPTPLWQGGTADCTATLENWDGYSKRGTIVPITSMSFTAAG
jgi:hypothetical protein